VRRYKRFLADVRLEDGTVVTAHTPNTGRMEGCSAPGSPVFISEADKRGRKLRYTLEIIDAGPSLVGVNTILPNRFFARAAAEGLLPDLSGYEDIRREVRAGDSRIDLLLQGGGRAPCYVEIKNVTLVQDGMAFFPDAVTARGAKHLGELERLANQQHRAVILYAVQRTDAGSVRPADHIDPRYGRALRQALAAGVEALAYGLLVSADGIRLGERLPVELDH